MLCEFTFYTYELTSLKKAVDAKQAIQPMAQSQHWENQVGGRRLCNVWMSLYLKCSVPTQEPQASTELSLL